MEAKTWTVDSIVALLNSNNRAVEKAIVAIYNRQTSDEQSAHTTRHSNSVGFSGADASRGTYYAKWILSGKRLTGDHLSKARAMAIKYRGQLCDIAASKAQKPTTVPSAAPVTESAPVSDNGTYQAKEESKCDMCKHEGVITVFYHMHTPVLGLCDGCNDKPTARLQ